MAQPKKKAASKTGAPGFASTESALVAGLVALAVGSILAMMYLSFAKVYTKAALYDGLICRQEQRPASYCRQFVERRMGFLPWGKVRQLKFASRAQASVTLHFSRQHHFTVQQSLPQELR